MFEWLKKLFFPEPEFFPGVILEKKLGNNIHEFKEGVAKSATPLFPVKKTSELKKFPYQYQKSSSSCVAFGTAKIACILYYLITGRKIKFSPGFWYGRRINKPGLGMILSDITALAEEGSCLYDLLPSENMTEDEMNALKVEDYQKLSAKAFSIPKDWIIQPDFDTVAASIEKTGKPVKAWFQFGPGEVWGTHYPKIKGNDKRWAHDMTATETFTDQNTGKQYIKLEDSADKEEYYEKYVDREFWQRCFIAVMPINFKFAIGTESKPTFTGTTKSAQDCLKFLGYFPLNQESTGYFGSITREAVRKFQIAYNIEPPFGNLGPITEAKLRGLFP